tara:strand:- start:331 stop:456 length:126 start_codon:yes stop_codon:yes gene_type:complete
MAFQTSTPRYGMRGERQGPLTSTLKGTFGLTEGEASIDPSF